MIDIGLEKTIIASLLIDEKHNVDTALMILKKTHFTFETHRKMFTAISDLSKLNETIDCLMVGNKSGIDHEYISKMMECSTVSNVEAHCNKLKELYNIRKILDVSEKIKTMSYGNESYHDIVGMIDKAMLDVDVVDKSYMVEALRDKVGDTFDSLEGESKINTPINTGFEKLDNIVGGMYPGEYVVLGARPGMGKTAFALNMMMSVSKAGHKVLIFSIEMQPIQLIKRYFSSEGGVNGNVIRNRKIGPGDYEKLEKAAEVIYSSNIFINSSKKNTVHDIRAIARRHLREHPETRLIVVDYLQYIRDSDAHRNDKRLANEEKSIVLCDLAAELGVTVLALAQLSRNCENRTDKRPILSDLKESGQIEQDAHIIMFLYRGYKYGDSRKVKSKDKDEWIDTEYEEDDVDVIVSKNREGDVGDVQMKFRGEYSSFYDIDNYHNDPYEREF